MAFGRFTPLLLTLSLAAPAAAQAPAATSAPGLHAAGMRDGRGPSPERREEWRAHMQAREAQEAADVALLLRLRPDQHAAYQAWRTSMTPPQGEHGRQGWRVDEPQAAPAPQTVPRELDRMQTRMAERETHARAHIDATRRFYASLGPEQQTLFDPLMRLDHGRHGGGPHGWRQGPYGPGDRPATTGEEPPPPGA